MANPKQPAVHVEAVQRAFAGMADDPEGREILARSAAVIKHAGAYRFVTATDRDYDSYRRFHRQALGRAN
jgi:phosphonate transport system substrate-binding protein